MFLRMEMCVALEKGKRKHNIEGLTTSHLTFSLLVVIWLNSDKADVRNAYNIHESLKINLEIAACPHQERRDRMDRQWVF